MISKAISNVCLYGNLDIRCRLDYEVGIVHLILHQYPQAHLYSGLHTCSSIRNSQGLAGIPALGAVVFSAIIPSVHRHSSGESQKRDGAKCNLTPSWLSVSILPPFSLSLPHFTALATLLQLQLGWHDPPSTTIPADERLLTVINCSPININAGLKEN